ncbi:GNAT family N-acetyltransferase [Uliginosibacterium paludis]|uniref:GNAT family N-acetyltransferase n=1 Tax=Uliginosibacterium paludis TaxID=1615952 RepID=A0ABV2CPI3_9RHOO
MPEAEFLTHRLLVRRWNDDDIDALHEVYGDEDAMRWVGDGHAISRDDCVRWLAVTRNNYLKRGYGMFAIELRAQPGVIGFCGIVHPDGQIEPEVKYALRRSHWGQGFATEAVRGLIDHAHRRLGIDFLIATIAPANLASHRVLLKAGMRCGDLLQDPDGTQTRAFHWQAGAGD